MKPLIFDFKEKPTQPDIDFSMVEYSNKFNLTIIKGTEKSAISVLSMDTVTMTKADESSDTDPSGITDNLKQLMDTNTQTMQEVETSDADPGGKFYSLMKMMDTRTITESVESADSDK